MGGTVTMDASSFAAIDKRLEALRAELAKLMAEDVPMGSIPMRPSSPQRRRTRSTCHPLKYYLPSFRHAKSFEEQYSIHRPGPHPVGYRCLSRNPSSPAYSMSPKFICRRVLIHSRQTISLPSPAYNTHKKCDFVFERASARESERTRSSIVE